MGRHATDKVQRTKGSTQRAAEILLLPTMQQTADDNAHDNAQQQSIHDYVLSSGGAADGGGTHAPKAVDHGDRTSSSLVAAADARRCAGACAIPYHSVKSCTRVCVRAHACARA